MLYFCFHPTLIQAGDVYTKKRNIGHIVPETKLCILGHRSCGNKTYTQKLCSYLFYSKPFVLINWMYVAPFKYLFLFVLFSGNHVTGINLSAVNQINNANNH